MNIFRYLRISLFALAAIALFGAFGVQEAQAATSTYDFVACGTTCDTSTSTWASIDLVDVFPFGGNTANRNDHTEATDAQYDTIESSNNTRWGKGSAANDENFVWLEMKIAEATSTINELSFTFEGDGGLASDYSIYVLKAAGAANWEVSANWVLLGTQNIGTSDVTISFPTSPTHI